MTTNAKEGAMEAILIPIMLCWNDEHGNFSNKIVKVDIHDSIELETIFVNDETYDFEGLECEVQDSAIIIEDQKYPFRNRRYWVGNIMWDLVGMKAEDVLRFLNHLQRTKHFHIESAETGLFNAWESGEPFGETEMQKIAEYVQDFRL